MTEPAARAVRRAAPADAAVVAALLDAFNTEYDTATPGPDVLTARLARLLPAGDLVALLAGEPPVGLAVVALRPSASYDGPVGLLEELYVVPGRRDRGTGTLLLQAAEQVVRERGGTVLEVNVDGDDTDARRFYARLGYLNSDPGREDPLLYYYRDL